MSIYDLKPQFQNLLRPAASALYRRGATANQVTAGACAVSVAVGALLCIPGTPRIGFIAVPVWMFLRMALNAIDGMLAREFGQKSHLGAYLNELTDVISDAALYLPFAFVAPFSPAWLGLLIFLAALSEFAGVLGLTLGASRRYDGPLGKSDRAFAFGALGLWIGATAALPGWLWWLMPLLAVGTAITIVNRVRGGLRELAEKMSL
jgi:CDP-diacylglycerol--glycerol-3-phosphate 3-phosphatidyltransferase